MRKLIFIFFGVVLLQFKLPAQSNEEDVPVEDTFNDVVGINLPTTEIANKNQLGFYISHRFGSIDGGYSEFWGLDSYANWRLGFNYGITDRLEIGVGRSSLDNLHDVSAKYGILRQSTISKPLSLVGQIRMGINGEKYNEVEREIYSMRHRMNYAISLMASRKLSDQWSTQVGLLMVHENLTRFQEESNTSMGAFGLIKWMFSPRYSLILEYGHNIHYNIAPGETYMGNFGFSFDYTTLNHNFSVFFSNTTQTTENQAFVINGGTFSSQNIHLGFNMSRNFRL